MKAGDKFDLTIWKTQAETGETEDRLQVCAFEGVRKIDFCCGRRGESTDNIEQVATALQNPRQRTAARNAAEPAGPK